MRAAGVKDEEVRSEFVGIRISAVEAKRLDEEAARLRVSRSTLIRDGMMRALDPDLTVGSLRVQAYRGLEQAVSALGRDRSPFYTYARQLLWALRAQLTIDEVGLLDRRPEHQRPHAVPKADEAAAVVQTPVIPTPAGAPAPPAPEINPGTLLTALRISGRALSGT